MEYLEYTPVCKHITMILKVDGTARKWEGARRQTERNITP